MRRSKGSSGSEQSVGVVFPLGFGLFLGVGQLGEDRRWFGISPALGINAGHEIWIVFRGELGIFAGVIEGDGRANFVCLLHAGGAVADSETGLRAACEVGTAPAVDRLVGHGN